MQCHHDIILQGSLDLMWNCNSISVVQVHDSVFAGYFLIKCTVHVRIGSANRQESHMGKIGLSLCMINIRYSDSFNSLASLHTSSNWNDCNVTKF